MVDKVKLLKCPFCGRRPSLGKGLRGRRTKDGEVAIVWLRKPSVKCLTCKIQRDCDSVEEAVGWWNTRAEVSYSAEGDGEGYGETKQKAADKERI